MQSNNTKVLVIDDEKHAYLLVKDMLLSADSSFQVDWAINYAEGWEALQRNKHDVYIIDYLLGNRRGTELLQKAREMNIDTPIVMLTGHGTHKVDLEAMQLGAQDYFEKTRLNPALLERSLRYAIERKRVEVKLQQLYRQVSELEQLKTDMIRIAAHDLASPITAILGLAHMLTEELAGQNASPDVLDCLNDITHSARKIHKITSDILSLERIQDMRNGGMHIIDLRKLATEVYEECLPEARRRSLTLCAQYVDELLRIEGNEAQLKEAIDNLINNALKYTPENGAIQIRLRKQEDRAIFTVEDNGYGIKECQQDRLFQPFYRANDAKTKHIEGTGLGLYLVKNIITRHKGEMIFASVYGKGSLFGFSIPLDTSSIISAS